MNLFFEKEAKISMVSDVKLETLQEFAEITGIPFYEQDNSCLWNVFANWYAQTQELPESCGFSMGYICSSIFGEMGYSCGTEVYFKEEKILDDVLSCLNELQAQENKTVDELVQELFEFIFSIYSEKIKDYTYKTQQVGFRISLPQAQKFNLVEGRSDSERFRLILDTYLNNKKD